MLKVDHIDYVHSFICIIAVFSSPASLLLLKPIKQYSIVDNLGIHKIENSP